MLRSVCLLLLMVGACVKLASRSTADVELEHGMRQGRPVDVAVLDELTRAHDEAALRQYALRLPDAQLRAEAKRRLMRLHVQASRFPLVRENAAAIEETMMRLGVNPVDLREHRVRRGWIDSSAVAGRGVLVRQDLHRQTDELLLYADNGHRGGLAVLHELPLRGLLQVELDAIDLPVTLCAPPEELDPSPCIPASEVSADNRVAVVDTKGTLRFVDRLGSRDAAELAASSRRLHVPIVVGGRPLVGFDWELRFEAPNDLVFDGAGFGGDGPELQVQVKWFDTGRLGYSVSRGTRTYQAVVERADAEHFHIISRGGDGLNGSDGAPGRDGFSGAPGTNAICPSTAAGNGWRGEDGTPGEDGAAGGDGGRGGDISVDVMPGSATPDWLDDLVRRTVLSEGGSGGSGGNGGRGGRGGSGGSGGLGATCFDTEGHVSMLPAGSSGFNGLDGRSGFPGRAGFPGSSGRVTIRVIQ